MAWIPQRDTNNISTGMDEMSTVELAVKQGSDDKAEALVSLILGGDLSKLTAEQKTVYYVKVCESVGLNQYTRPFQFMKFQGKEILYADKGCAEQLRAIHGISIESLVGAQVGDLYIVTAKARAKDGRVDQALGAVSIKGLSGEALANAMMKSETKAKRRVTLSMEGLGNIPDESEIEDMRATEQGKRTNEIHAAVVTNSTTVEAPVSTGDFVITFGRYATKKMSELTPEEISENVKYWHKRSEAEERPLNGRVAEMVQAMEAHMATILKSEIVPVESVE